MQSSRPANTATSFRTSELYRPSGAVPPSGLIIALMVLAIVALVIGIGYSASVVFVPFVKLRGLCTFFAATILGGAVGRVCRWTKFRNRPAMLAVAVAASLTALYVSWAVHAALVAAWKNGLNENTISLMLAGFDPRFIVDWANSLFENGLWGLGGGALAGWPLVGVWLVEAALLLTGVIIGTATYGNAPFCEGCGQWTKQQPAIANLPVASDDPQWSRIAVGNVDAFKKLQLNVPQSDSSLAQYVQIDLADCSSCTQSDFLSAISITTGLNAKGEPETKAEPIFEYLRISRDQRDEMEAFASAMQEALAEMDPAEMELTESQEHASHDEQTGRSDTQ